MRVYCIIAGNAGVYSGWIAGYPNSIGADGRVVTEEARFLRRYTVAGRSGDGSAAELALRGLEPGCTGPTAPVPGEAVILGVLRVFPVADEAVASFHGGGAVNNGSGSGSGSGYGNGSGSGSGDGDGSGSGYGDGYGDGDGSGSGSGYGYGSGYGSGYGDGDGGGS